MAHNLPRRKARTGLQKRVNSRFSQRAHIADEIVRCDLGRLSEYHFCSRPAVTEIGGVRVCQYHLNRANRIAATTR